MSALRAVAWGLVGENLSPRDFQALRTDVRQELRRHHLYLSSDGDRLHSVRRERGHHRYRGGRRTKLVYRGDFKQCCIEALKLIEGEPNGEAP